MTDSHMLQAEVQRLEREVLRLQQALSAEHTRAEKYKELTKVLSENAVRTRPECGALL